MADIRGVDVTNGSSSGPRPVNRHGIPLLGEPPRKCAWRRCPSTVASDLHEHMPLCFGHAEIVRRMVVREHERVAALWSPRRRDDREAAEAAVAEEARKERERSEVIYYAQIGGHIKIGWTGRLEQRMRSYPPNTTLLAVHPGTREDEKLLHRKFKVHLSHGNEWYPLVPVILDHIKRVIAEHGAPPDMTFGARPTEVRRPKDKPQLQAKYGPLLRG